MLGLHSTTPYDSDNRHESFCTATAPCDIGQDGCDNDSQWRPDLVCVQNHGTDYGGPIDWDFRDAP
jgi:hypothetical protein